MIGSCRLNNKSMRNVRRSDAYQAMAIDLALLGVISKEECEMLLDGGIPNGIVLPNGSAGKLISEKDLPAKPDFIQTEPEQTLEPETIMPNADIVGVGTQTPDAGEIVTDSGEVSPIDTEDNSDVQPELIPADETQEPVNDEGRPESND